ncbi:sulfurtransferase [Brevibacillus fluminis]|uniref:Sulfurtransferase n=1 Tax=Brevibacillus fluminis TaxID=511487 RepID=A0A3M8DAQ3_9BACL|nr:sulfurtransferase [Brevibacillus fluminis]RNB85152.1 sulfurtransferase [Brevibacillus fluminis]
MSQQHLVSREWLQSHLGDANLVLVDCRFTLGKPGVGLNEYVEAHIPGALYFDLEHDLSGPKAAHGGRHPLPSVGQLQTLFSNAGIDQDTFVVAYDEQDLAHASRLWWLLRYLGHEKVAVLNGGFAGWRQAGLPTTAEVKPAPDAKTFIPNVQLHMLVGMEDVKQRDEKAALLDSRAPERYRGEVEPLDPKAGHIPGAANYFYKHNFAPDGELLPNDALQERFRAVSGKDEIIAYCGSGVTGCVNVLALYQAGRTDAKLYAGSWSDWTSYADNPVATGEE